MQDNGLINMTALRESMNACPVCGVPMKHDRDMVAVLETGEGPVSEEYYECHTGHYEHQFAFGMTTIIVGVGAGREQFFYGWNDDEATAREQRALADAAVARLKGVIWCD